MNFKGYFLYSQVFIRAPTSLPSVKQIRGLMCVYRQYRGKIAQAPRHLTTWGSLRHRAMTPAATCRRDTGRKRGSWSNIILNFPARSERSLVSLKRLCYLKPNFSDKSFSTEIVLPQCKWVFFWGGGLLTVMKRHSLRNESPLPSYYVQLNIY